MIGLNEYLEEIVEPTVADFEANPGSRRHAFLACVAVYHSLDYIARPQGKKGHGGLRKPFGTSPAFATVDRVANSFKHVISDGLYPPPLASSEVITRPPAFYGTAVWGLSCYGDAVGGVTLNRQRNLDLLPIVREAVEFVCSKAAESQHG